MLSEKISNAVEEFKAAVYEKDILSPKTQYLISLAVSAAISCEPCMKSNYQAAKECGASEAEISSAIGIAIYISSGKCRSYASMAIEELERG